MFNNEVFLEEKKLSKWQIHINKILAKLMNLQYSNEVLYSHILNSGGNSQAE